MIDCHHLAALRELEHDNVDHNIFGSCETCEYSSPSECICGYKSCCGIDFDEHVAALQHDYTESHYATR